MLGATRGLGKYPALTAFSVMLAACSPPRSQGIAVEIPVEPSTRSVDIAVTCHGFEPSLVSAHEGDVLRMTFLEP